MALLPRIQQYDPLVTSENMASLLPAYTRTPEVMPPTAVPASEVMSAPSTQTSRGAYYDPETYYISPVDAANDPALQVLYGGGDPFSGLTPEQQAYATGLSNFVAGQTAQTALPGGYYSTAAAANPYSNLGDIAQGISATSDPVAQLGLLNQLQQNQSFADAYSQPYEQNTTYTQNLVGSGDTLAGVATIGYDQPVMLVNDMTGETVYTGRGFEGLQAATPLAEQLSADEGRNAAWSLYTDRGSGFELAARDTPDQSGLGVFADIALPALGAIALPVAGGFLGGALGAGLGAAGGSLASSVAQGRGIGDALTRAGISGLTAGGLSALSGTPIIPAGTESSVIPISDAVAQNFANVAARTADVPNTILVTAPSIAATPASGAIGSLAGSGVTNVVSGGTPRTEPDITITADRLPPPAPGASFGEAFAPFAPDAVNAVTPSTPGETVIEVTANGQQDTDLGAPDVVNAVTPSTPSETVIEVVADRPTPLTGEEIAAATGLVTAPVIATGGSTPPTDTTADTADTTKDNVAQDDTSGGLLNEIMKYYGLGSLGIGTIADLLGGSGGSAGATTPYASQLGPMPTFTRGGFTPYAGDYETYGFGPEHTFFGGAPAPAPATTTGPQASLLNPGPPADRTRQELLMLFA